jgi:class 3 adenylate cyclase
MEALLFANTVLSELGMVVEACGGVVDKFTGDGFLAHFGVLEEGGKHSADACWCAVRMRESLTKLNFERHIGNQPVVTIGVGIHTGEIASGVITTTSKAEFTVLGGVVNTASRIESLTKHFTVDCLVSEDVYNVCKDEFTFQKMPVQPLRGIRSEQPTYWLLPTNIFLGNSFPSS